MERRKRGPTGADTRLITPYTSYLLRRFQYVVTQRLFKQSPSHTLKLLLNHRLLLIRASLFLSDEFVRHDIYGSWARAI